MKETMKHRQREGVAEKLPVDFILASGLVYVKFDRPLKYLTDVFLLPTISSC